MSTFEEDCIPVKLLKKHKPKDNGRLEVAWRIYDALCNITTGDLTGDQVNILAAHRKAAYEQWEIESSLMDHDKLQGPNGFAAIKKQHLKNLADKRKKKK